MLNSSPPRTHQRKLCRVCGDVALAFNFNGLSCESCKAFFRRNALHSKKLKCVQTPTQDRCEINKFNRRKCSHCRLLKCLAIGMKPELLLTTHEEKSHKRKRFTTNTGSGSKTVPLVAIAHANHSTTTTTNDLSSSVSTASPHSSASENSQETFRDAFLLESCFGGNSTPTATAITATTTTTITTTTTTTTDSTTRETSPESDDSDESGVWKLSTHERSLLKEVKEAAFYDTTENLNGEAVDFGHVFRLQEYYIAEMVNFCNQFDAFQCLPQEDKLIRIKGSFMELLLLRAAFYYVRDRDGFTMKANHTGDHYVFVGLTEILSPLHDAALLLEFRAFLISLFEELEEDEDLKDLVGVVLIFRTRNRHLHRPDYIRYQYFVYRLLLERYLTRKYQDLDEAQAKHRALMRHLETLSHFKRVFCRLFSRMIDDMEGGIAHALSEIYLLNSYVSE